MNFCNAFSNTYISSALSYGINSVIVKMKYTAADKMNFETPLTFLVWIISIVSIALIFAVSSITIKSLSDGTLFGGNFRLL